MKLELFVDKPSIDLMEGIKVKEDTEVEYSNENVEQELKNLVLDTLLKSEGTNGINVYSTVSHIHLHLNEGDILLFDENRGYYLPSYPVESIEDAISDIESLRGFELSEERKEGC